MADGAAIRGFDYGPFRDGESPNLGIFPTTAELDQDVDILAQHTQYIRLYSTAHGFYSLIPEAVKDRVRVIPGAFLNDGDAGNNYTEITSLVNTIGQYGSTAGFPFAIVGTEAISQHHFTADNLIANMNQVRFDTSGAVPIATAEDWSTWIANPNLAAASDVILVDVYPYHEGISIDQAVSYAIGRVQQVEAAYPNKEVLIGETGWPSIGETIGQAVASAANEESYAAGILSATAQQKIGILYFEPFDEAWKIDATGQTNQGNFGLFASERNFNSAVPKGDVEDIFAGSSTLYAFLFTYNDWTAGGNFYYGTVADDGRFRYSVNESIATPLGEYFIYNAIGATPQAAGTVSDYLYHDGVSSHRSYQPYYYTYQGYSLGDGGGGLGNDFDFLRDGGGNFHIFGGGLAEALMPPPMLFDFLFTFNDYNANGASGGDYYYGTVADDGHFGYAIGATLATALGTYYIYATQGVTAQAAGTVDDYFYWDGASSHQAYIPYYSAPTDHSPISGAGGLGNDFDYILRGNQFHVFGGSLAEALA